MKFTNEDLVKMYKIMVEGKEEAVTYIQSEPFCTGPSYKVTTSNKIELEEKEISLEDMITEQECLSNDELDSILDELGENFKNGSNIYKSKHREQKYIVLSDTHIPFQRKKVLQAIEAKFGNKDYDLILCGDILDCHDISTFPKAYSVGFKQEISIFKDYLKRWAKIFNNVYIISGNHEARLPMYLRKRVSAEVVEMLPDDLISYAIRDLGLNNIKYTSGDTVSWYLQIDNVLLCHPRGNVSSGILATAKKVQEFFSSRGLSANVFISGHTHKMGQATHNGYMLLESGCLCLPQDYAMDGKVGYTPEASGFVTFTSKNGVVNFNDVKLHYIS